MHFILDIFMGFFSIYFVIAHLDPTRSALIASIAIFAGNIIHPLTGYLADRIKGKSILFMSLILASIFSSSIGLTTNYSILFIMVILSRIGSALFHPAGATISSLAGGNRSSASLAIFATTGTIGYSFSQILFSYFTKYLGFRNSYLLAIPGVILALYYLFFSKVSINTEGQTIKLNASLRIIKERFMPLLLLYFVMVFRSAFIMAINFFIAKIFKDWGFGRLYYSSANMIFMLSSACGLLAAGVLSSKIKAKILLTISLTAFLPFFLIFLVAGFKGNLSLTYLFLILTGFILYSGHASNITMGQKIAPEITSTVSGILMGFAWATSSFGPTICALSSNSIPIFPGLASGLVILSILPLIAGFLVQFLPHTIQKY